LCRRPKMLRLVHVLTNWRRLCQSDSVIVETKIVGSKDAELLHLQVPVAIGSLRDLFVLLVRHELASYEQRRAASMTLRVLTPTDLARGVETGTYGRETRALAAPPPEAQAIQRAVEAFTDGLFFAFIDGVPVEFLDTPITARPDSTLRLLRLVALAGG
jgi:hypothetical protein